MHILVNTAELFLGLPIYNLLAVSENFTCFTSLSTLSILSFVLCLSFLFSTLLRQAEYTKICIHLMCAF